MDEKKISIIIPAYKEAAVIGYTLSGLNNFLRKNNYNFEIIVVSDGDQETFKKATEFALENPRIKIYGYPENHGKGYTLKYGFSKTTGDPVFFFDAGGDFMPEEIKNFLEYKRINKVNIVIGSKRHPLSRVEYPLERKIISRLGQLLTKILFDLNIRDTQVGLKLFDRGVLEKIMPLLLIKQYAFDIELLALAKKYDYKITEAPVTLKLNFSNSGINFNSIFKTLWDTLAVFYRLKILKYYDKIEKHRNNF